MPDGLYRDTLLTDDKVKRLNLLVINEMPSKEEANLISPLAGSYGYARWKMFFEKTGWEADEVGFTFLRRCYAGLYQGRVMASAADARDGAKKCRQYDTLLGLFAPDTALVTHAMEDTIKTQAYYRMMLADLSKARTLTREGCRVILLMGRAPVQYFLPSLGDGYIKWCGSYFSL